MSDASLDVVAVTDLPRPRRNWWKIGFFVALLAFEFTRELLVVAGSEGAIPNASAYIYSSDGIVVVQGSWQRIDGGGSLVPGTVTIECRQETGHCVEASTNIIDNYVYAPDLSWFDARFASESVSYVNDVPACARYSVRIDLEMKKAFAVRQKKEQATNPNCALLEDRIEMQIADGYETRREDDPFKGHFVPILQLLAAIF